MQGYEHAKKAALAFLDTFKEKADPDDRELLRCVARTSLRTKLYEDLADQLTDIVVDAVLTIRKPEEAIDLFMVGGPLGQHHSLCWTSQSQDAIHQVPGCLGNNCTSLVRVQLLYTQEPSEQPCLLALHPC